MSIVSLFLIVCLGILIFIAYFHISNFILDHFVNNKSKKFSHETSIRAVIFIAPAFIVLFIFILYPVFETVRLSFYDKFGRDFVGLYNYIWAFKDPEFRRGILNNLGWLLVVPTLSTFFGLVIAKLADKIWWGTFAKSIIFMPMAISFVGAGVIWKFIYEYRGPGDVQIGLLNAIIVFFGFEPQAWITIPIWNNLFLMAIMIWIQTGLALVIFSAALRGIPKEMLEASFIDGANFFVCYLKIVLPILKPAAASVIIITGTWVWNDFLNPLILLGPLEGTTVTVGLYRMVGQYSINFGELFAFMVLISLPVLIGYLILQKYFIEGLLAGSSK